MKKVTKLHNNLLQKVTLIATMILEMIQCVMEKAYP